MNEALQIEILSAELERIRPNITKSDKKTAKAELKLSSTTISKYLNKKGRDEDTAASLIKIFKERISKRNEVAQLA